MVLGDGSNKVLFGLGGDKVTRWHGSRCIYLRGRDWGLELFAGCYANFVVVVSVRGTGDAGVQ